MLLRNSVQTGSLPTSQVSSHARAAIVYRWGKKKREERMEKKEGGGKEIRRKKV